MEGANRPVIYLYISFRCLRDLHGLKQLETQPDAVGRGRGTIVKPIYSHGSNLTMKIFVMEDER